ncbi:MAG TPA: hypothetical protein VJT73_06870 [Polyangiaceae bacterium]|nr:hypothetical protein [Polyangiaceae bacterium]
MDKLIGQVLFLLAIGPNFIVLAYGLVRGTLFLTGAALAAMPVPARRHPHPDDAFHRVDSIATPAFEQIFMFIAIALVLLGLPAALAAIFHFALPLLGDGWTR